MSGLAFSVAPLHAITTRRSRDVTGQVELVYIYIYIYIYSGLVITSCHPGSDTGARSATVAAPALDVDRRGRFAINDDAVIRR